MDFDITIYCSNHGCGNYVEGKKDDEIFCYDCFHKLKNEITELENKVYDLEKYIEKEEL